MRMPNVAHKTSHCSKEHIQQERVNRVQVLDSETHGVLSIWRWDCLGRLCLTCALRDKTKWVLAKRGKENVVPDKPLTPDDRLQQEFNRWAQQGEGEKMERHHLDITEKTIRKMQL